MIALFLMLKDVDINIHILMVTILINIMITTVMVMIINPPGHEDHGKVLPVLYASQVKGSDPLPILVFCVIMCHMCYLYRTYISYIIISISAYIIIIYSSQLEGGYPLPILVQIIIYAAYVIIHVILV